jgi:hypothetical protein
VLPFDGLGGVVEGRLDVIFRQMRIVLENLFMSPPVRQQLDEELDGDARPSNDGFSNQHLWVHDDSIFPSHLRLLLVQ